MLFRSDLLDEQRLDLAQFAGVVILRAGPGNADLDIAKFLIEDAGVAAVPGSAFGAPGYLRFSYATSEEVIDQGIAAVRAAVERARSA